jgi:phage baseplate assembly protein gpV
VCLKDERDEAGVVLGAIYSDVDRAPVNSADKFHLGFKDGTAVEYDRAAHLLALNFQDETTIKYDANAHSLMFNFADGTVISYRAVTHMFAMTGAPGASATIVAPAGIILQAGGAQVTITPSGVSVTPPLPLSSTVAQT